MILLLRALFVLILVSMLGTTSWASLDTPLFQIPHTVVSHPWFIATLLDAYWAFISFYVWVAWKEQAAGARVLWFLAIVALGNIAMSAYMLRELFRLRGQDGLAELFTRRRDGHWFLPASLGIVAALVYFLAWQASSTALRPETTRVSATSASASGS